MTKPFTVDELRDSYIEFFKDKNCTHYPSASLVPANDPTILFTVAGMAQFKDSFLGRGSHDFTRATTCQKCIRTNDIMEVGRTPRHHTFFEMLGNFSFNDYFKRDAIFWAWEYLTEVLELDKERLSVSVHDIDDDAYNIWADEIKVPKDRIFRMGDSDNFWPAGAPTNGPMGPGGCCSEIFWDFKTNDDPNDNLTKGGDRFVEVWNLVFPEFNVTEPIVDGKYTLENLGRTNIDTGMGLERLACVIQGKTNNFDIDTLRKIVTKVEEVTGASYDGDDKTKELLRRIADHVRAVSFCISDGVIPGNTGRAYIVRRLIRRATLDIDKLGVKTASLYKIVVSVMEVMSKAYPEISKRQSLIEQTLESEENSFRKSLSKGMDLMDSAIARHQKNNEKKFSGDDTFELFTTHGFPLELIEEILEEKGMTIDKEQYDIRWNEFVKISNAKTKSVFDSSAITDAKSSLAKTDFLGYEKTKCDAKIEIIELDGEKVETANEGDKIKFVLDKTVFYAESGGQSFDTGTISNDNFSIKIISVQKDDGIFVHEGIVSSGTAKCDTVKCEINTEKRNKILAHHSATHLLHTALCNFVGDHVEQQGSSVDDNCLRFDYNTVAPLKPEDIEKIEDFINTTINKELPITVKEMSIDDAKALGAKAQFDEKYGDKVRVVNMDGVSIELCGGTHASNTKDIKAFTLIKDDALSAGIRRITAYAGVVALEENKEKIAIANECGKLLNLENTDIKDIAKLKVLFKAKDEEIVTRVSKLTNAVNDIYSKLEEEIDELTGGLCDRVLALQNIQKKASKRLQDKAIGDAVKNINPSDIETIDDIELITKRIDGLDAKTLGEISDNILANKENAAIVLASEFKGKAFIVCAITKTLVDRKISAGKMVSELAKIVGGGGGGKPDKASAGGKNPTAIPEVLASAKAVLTNQL